MKKLCAMFAACMLAVSVYAAVDTTVVTKRVLENNFVSEKFEFYRYFMGTYYKGVHSVFDVRGNVLSLPGNKRTLRCFKVNPSGGTYSFSFSGESRLYVNDLYDADNNVAKLNLEKEINCFCYTNDAKYIVVNFADGELRFLDAQSYKAAFSIETGFSAESASSSWNNYFIGLKAGNTLEIWSVDSRLLKKKITVSGTVTDFAFSRDGSYLAVTSNDGRLVLYDARNFSVMREYDGLGMAAACDIHPEGKYIAVAMGESRIIFINRLDDNDRVYYESNKPSIDQLAFINSATDKTFLACHSSQATVYADVNELAPYYAHLLSDELNERMDEWVKRMDGESLEDYELRVNEETRVRQMALFEQEIATRMAEDLLNMSNVSIGGFNMDTEVLTLNFDKMPPIFLNVPENRVKDFIDPEKLEFSNAMYGITADDKFELVYVDVKNTATGEVYTFDNRERRSLDFLNVQDNFVPLSLIQMSNMEEVKLEAIKEKVVAEATETNTISNHTRINVSTHVESDVDADGKKILDYKIKVDYDVDAEFSQKEDFGSGKYVAEESGAASAMLNIIKKAFETDFAQYIKAGKKVKVSVTGSADASPINGKIAYNGVYGEYAAQPVWKKNSFSQVSLTKKDGITDNDQLAFARAVGLKSFIQNNVAELDKMNADYEYHVEVSDKKGGEYRRIAVEFTFIDAF